MELEIFLRYTYLAMSCQPNLTNRAHLNGDLFIRARSKRNYLKSAKI